MSISFPAKVRNSLKRIMNTNFILCEKPTATEVANALGEVGKGYLVQISSRNDLVFP